MTRKSRRSDETWGQKVTLIDGTILTMREKEVFDLCFENDGLLSIAEMAKRLHISEKGVKWRVGNVLKKTGYRFRRDLRERYDFLENCAEAAP